MTIQTPFFIFAKVSSLRIFDVVGVRGMCRARSKLTSSTPCKSTEENPEKNREEERVSGIEKNTEIDKMNS